MYFCRCEGQQGKKPKTPEEFAYNEQTLSKWLSSMCDVELRKTQNIQILRDRHLGQDDGRPSHHSFLPLWSSLVVNQTVVWVKPLWRTWYRTNLTQEYLTVFSQTTRLTMKTTTFLFC
jgi:hypothetical protein